MRGVVLFVLTRLYSRTFWFFVMSTFVAVVMMWMRGEFRNQIFQAAANTVGKRYPA